MENIRAMRAFVEVAHAGSFAKAAARLNCSSTSISRLVRECEDEFGHALFSRTTRSVALNSFGQRWLPECEQILNALNDLHSASRDEVRVLTGTLRIASTTAYARQRLFPLLSDFVERHPQLNIHWRLTDDRLDLSAQGMDMAVRVAVLNDSDMVVRRLGKVEIWLVAAPSLLKREGNPASLHDVAQMTCTVCTVPHFKNRWPLDPDAFVDGPVWTDCGEASRDAAIAGLGVAFLPDFMVEDAVSSGQLVRLFPERSLSSVEVAILYPGRRQISAAAAAFGNYLAEKLNPM